ncbi:MAG: glycosyltransferase family 1 protein [Chlamydiae bacterium]|nr:glycosyltransferase family 1 protein [Chlamydiota bacterium]
MITICVDARMYLASGIGTYLRNILKLLHQETGFSLKVITSRSVVEHAIEVKQWDCVFAESPIYSIKEQWEIPYKVPKCDIFWSPHYNIPLLPVRAKKRIVTIHDVFHLAHMEHLPFHKSLYANIVTKRAAKYSDIVVTDSEFSKNEICKYTGIGSDKIRKILLGVDFSAYSGKISLDETNAILAKYNPPEKFILFVGNLKSHKNLDRLIEAYKLLVKNTDTPPHFLILGKHFADFPIQERVLQDTTLRGLVHFYSSVDNKELCWFYSNALVTVLPSLYEGFGFPPLEAMCCGCPTVVSNAASLPEICGDASLYIDPQSSISIYKGLEKAINDVVLRMELSQKGYCRVKEFQWKKTFEAHLKVFEEVLS